MQMRAIFVVVLVRLVNYTIAMFVLYLTIIHDLLLICRTLNDLLSLAFNGPDIYLDLVYLSESFSLEINKRAPNRARTI